MYDEERQGLQYDRFCWQMLGLFHKIQSDLPLYLVYLWKLHYDTVLVIRREIPSQRADNKVDDT